MPQEQRPTSDVPQGPFAGNALMSMFAPQAGSVGSGQQVNPPTSAGTPQGAAPSTPPFVAGTLTRQQLDALARGGGRPSVRYLIDRTTGTQYPYRTYPSRPDIGIGANGAVIRLDAVDPNKYDDASTAPVSVVEETPQALDLTVNEIKSTFPDNPKFNKKAHEAGITAALSLPPGKRLPALREVLNGVRQEMSRLDTAQQRAHEREMARSASADSKSLADDLKVEGMKNRWSDEITKSKQYTSMIEMSNIVDQVRQAYDAMAADPKRAKELLGIIDTKIAYANSKASDMGSAVREGELKLWQQVGGLVQGLKARMSGLASGDGRLFMEKTRKQMYDLLLKSQENYKKDVYSDVVKPVWKRAKSFAGRRKLPIDMEGIVPGSYQQFILSDPEFGGGAPPAGKQNLIDPDFSGGSSRPKMVLP